MNTKTIHVPHLGGTEVGYQMPKPYDPSKPTLILVNSFTTSSELYRQQFDNAELNAAMNLLAIEPLGHGLTKTKVENWTYWDTAIANIQIIDALSIDHAFVLGTSQGGWIAVRMALIAPHRIQGVIPLGTSLDYESERTRLHGCWNPLVPLTKHIESWTVKPGLLTEDFEPDTEYCDFLIDIGFNECSTDVREFWRKSIKHTYRGDEGRKRIRMAAINLRDRDGLHGRLTDVRCPFLWLHGTSDAVYSISNAQEEIKLLVNAASKEVISVEGGAHFLSATHPDEVGRALIEFVGKHKNWKLEN
ncbi:alpha/beta hydrolase fold family protein [Sclerotinia borealis F-4128]|uniref:Alpha/beta hydrolase fold family protein n=1 Tax=Sclerotinia borealis (strain F-4128) TaxID=1432307 RepID=W9C9S6_SCLBF|nr:alpha/beta hydrolase fold family protein [Sclerotinia borealis F-4128]